jgi:hypothetical protein
MVIILTFRQPADAIVAGALAGVVSSAASFYSVINAAGLYTVINAAGLYTVTNAAELCTAANAAFLYTDIGTGTSNSTLTTTGKAFCSSTTTDADVWLDSRP